MLIPVLMLVGGILGGIVAQNKGRNLFVWTLLCGLMPLCLLILFALPKLAQQGVSRPCPFCLRIIPWHARICAHCQQHVPLTKVQECAYCGEKSWQGEEHCPNCKERMSPPL